MNLLSINLRKFGKNLLVILITIIVLGYYGEWGNECYLDSIEINLFQELKKHINNQYSDFGEAIYVKYKYGNNEIERFNDNTFIRINIRVRVYYDSGTICDMRVSGNRTFGTWEFTEIIILSCS